MPAWPLQFPTPAVWFCSPEPIPSLNSFFWISRVLGFHFPSLISDPLVTATLCSFRWSAESSPSSSSPDFRRTVRVLCISLRVFSLLPPNLDSYLQEPYSSLLMKFIVLEYRFRALISPLKVFPALVLLFPWRSSSLQKAFPLPGLIVHFNLIDPCKTCLIAEAPQLVSTDSISTVRLFLYHWLKETLSELLYLPTISVSQWLPSPLFESYFLNFKSYFQILYWLSTQSHYRLSIIYFHFVGFIRNFITMTKFNFPSGVLFQEY